MEHKDYYKTMGVAPTATDKEIKLAYRRLARKYHPDISKEANAEAHFKEVGEAYEALRDPKKRQAYDDYLQQVASRQREPHHYASENSGAQYQSEYDFFESLFGGKHPFRQHRDVSVDRQATLEISLEDASQGAVKEILYNQQTLRVKIPKGICSGQKIRLAGQGEPGINGGASGDLYLTLTIKKHPLFEVLNNDIYITLPVTPWEVALGANIAVPTLTGKVDLKIPPGSQGGQKLRLKGRGLAGHQPGDQYIILKIITPKPTTEAARALYEKMAEVMPMNPREAMGV